MLYLLKNIAYNEHWIPKRAWIVEPLPKKSFKHFTCHLSHVTCQLYPVTNANSYRTFPCQLPHFAVGWLVETDMFVFGNQPNYTKPKMFNTKIIILTFQQKVFHSLEIWVIRFLTRSLPSMQSRVPANGINKQTHTKRQRKWLTDLISLRTNSAFFCCWKYTLCFLILLKRPMATHPQTFIYP